MLIKLTSFFTGNAMYINAYRISIIEACKTEGGSEKTRITCPKPVYVKESPEEIIDIIKHEWEKSCIIGSTTYASV